MSIDELIKQKTYELCFCCIGEDDFEDCMKEAYALGRIEAVEEGLSPLRQFKQMASKETYEAVRNDMGL